MLLFKQLFGLNTKGIKALAPTQCVMPYTFKDSVNLLSHHFALKLQD